MLRQIHIFHKNDCIYNHTYSLALGDDELNNVIKIIQSYIDMPMIGKTFQKPVSDHFQIFHRSEGEMLFLFITDLVDNLEYVGPTIENTIEKFNELFPTPEDIKTSTNLKREYVDFLREQQYELHSKIAIVGPHNSGKTMLFNMFRSNGVHPIMNFASSSIYSIDNLKFDLWDFELKDNFSLLWSKFIQGSDLVILLFDLSNYHLRVINHFLDLQKQESKFSKLLIIGNKRDMVREEDIRIIKNELDLSNIEEISLIDAGAKEKIRILISKVLNLKKLLPHNFTEMFNEAKSVESDGNSILAVAKYKELVKISNEYQDFTYVTDLKNKIKSLQEKIDEQVKNRKEIDAKKKFEIPGKIQFTRRIQVQPLPRSDTLIKAPPIEIPKSPTKIKQKTEDLMLFSTTDSSDGEEIDKEDITLDINKVIPEEKRPTLEVVEEKNEDYPNMLQQLIEKQGSSLTLNLCEQLLTELQKTLSRPLTVDDLELAANVFVKHDLS
jgi:GTPase SAR1 family protein